MKTLYKSALLAALGLASVPAVQAVTYPTGDLILGFTTGSGTDVLFDLGAESSLPTTSGASTSWDLTSLLTGINLNSVQWGVIGNLANSGSPRTAFTTVAVGSTPGLINGNTQFGQLNSSAKAIYGNFSSAGAGSTGSVLAGDSTDNSWYEQTISGPLTSSYVNAFENPNVTGLTSAYLFSVQNNNTAGSELGTFSLQLSGSIDTMIYTAPEPGTCSLLGGAGVLALFFRNQLRRKHA